MKSLSATTRVTFGLTCLSVSAWLVAFALGLFPDEQAGLRAGRAQLCENVTMYCSLLANRNEDERIMKMALDGLVQRSDDVQSAAIRRSDGSLLFSSGEHSKNWNLPRGRHSTATQMRAPIMAGTTEWGMVEVRFRQSPVSGSLPGWLSHPLMLPGIFVVAATYLLYFFYLRKMLVHLNPSRVIPQRVRQTLDSLSNGLFVVDMQDQILLANSSFADAAGTSADDLTGRRASELSWETDGSQAIIEGYPWGRAIRDNTPQVGELLTLRNGDKEPRILCVRAVPVQDGKDQQRGALVTFDDVTALEQNRNELRQLLTRLTKSRDEIKQQNLELERLSRQDPLTGCLNRRALFAHLEEHWNTSARHDYPLSCIMIDVDHFKAVNDTHGHQTGDMVLQKMGDLLRRGRRPADAVCRYGGEEFCLLLAHTDLDGACELAEQLRIAIAAADFNGLAITASIGVSTRSPSTQKPEEMIDEADKCLYVAKRNGRNQVIRYDEAADQIAASTQQIETGLEANDASARGEDDSMSIPFHAVTSLTSALAFRDNATAEHSRRVADLCAATARDLMPVVDAYELEMAALLHDIGKIGVPDAVLLKPGPLTPAEWEVMGMHDRIGVEIVNSTFASETLLEIIENHHAFYGGHGRDDNLPTGDDIPLGARILTIADAYDAMVSDRVYRNGMGQAAAFAELRRCAGSQFDPALVEHFVEIVTSRDELRRPDARSVSKQTALQLGEQMERLAHAVDNGDFSGLGMLAGRLHATANKQDFREFAEVAADLQSAAGGRELNDTIRLVNELLDLCRSAQNSFLDETDSYRRMENESDSTEGEAVGVLHHDR